MKKLINIFLLLSLFIFSVSISSIAAEGEPTSANYTPSQVMEKVKWMPQARVSGAITDGPDDIYFVQSSVPAPGYIHLRDGRILSGSLQIQKKFNKSEKDVTEKCIMSIDGKRKVYADWEVAYYYIAFTPSALEGKVSRWSRVGIGTSSYFEYKLKSSELPGEIFGQGTLTFGNGDVRSGVFAFDKAMDRSENYIYRFVYLVESKSSNVIIYEASTVRNGNKTLNGKEYHFQQLFFGVTELEGWIATLKAGKVDATNDLVKGTLITDNDKAFTGSVGFGKGKVPSFVYFVNEDNSFIAYYDENTTPQAEAISALVDGKEIQYTFSDDGYYSLLEMNKLWEKNTKKKNDEEIHTLVNGSITLKNGTELKGKVAQQKRKGGFFYQGGIFYQDENGQLKIYSKRNVKFFSQTLSTGVTKFAVIPYHVENPAIVMNKQAPSTQFKIVNYTEKAAAMKNTGFVTIGNKQINGKVMIEGNEVWYIDEEVNLNIVRSNKVTSVQINEPSGSRVFYGGPNAFNELFFPFEAVSYYKNPFPTHCNEKASRIANSINQTLQDVAKTATVIAAGQGTENQNKSLDQLTSEVENLYDPLRLDPNECSVPYEEYFLVINNTKEKMIVYKENIKSVVTSLMLGCESLEKINKLIRKNDNLNDIHAMVKYVNTAKCASANFDILEPTPLAAYKWRSGMLSTYHYDEAGKKGTKRAMTDWYKGWIQTIGGNKVEGLIRVIGDKTIENREMTKEITRGNTTVTRTGSSILNRKVSFEYDAVELRIREEGKLATLVYSFYLDKDAIRSVGRDKDEGSIEGEFAEFTDLEAYEPSKELFLSEEVKIFNPNGSFTNTKGETFEGKITMEVPPLLWFAVGATFEDAEGNRIDLSPKSDVKQLRVITAGVEKTYAPFREVFVEVVIDGPKFRYFRNPYPEAKAEGVAALGNFASLAKATTTGSTDPNAKTLNSTLADANRLEAFKKEYVFQNAESNDEIIIHSANAKRLLQSYLGLCDYFNGLDKKQKDEFVDSDNPKKTIEILDKCY